MKLKILMLLMTVVMVGCDGYAHRLANSPGYQNVREVGRGYVMYEIENGKVTCREHVSRSELTCWEKTQ